MKHTIQALLSLTIPFAAYAETLTVEGDLVVDGGAAVTVGSNTSNTPGLFTAGEYWGLNSFSSTRLFISESLGHPAYRRDPNTFGFLYSISSDNTTGPSEPGLVLYNNHAQAGNWSPLIVFGNREIGSTPYNSATAGIAARTPSATTSNGAWSDGELHFFTSGDGTKGLRQRVIIDRDGNFGVGVFTLAERMHVNGAVVLGISVSDTEGAIRYNSTISDFEGYNGTAWLSLTSGGSGGPAGPATMLVSDNNNTLTTIASTGADASSLTTTLSGKVLLESPQGDISMGSFGTGL